MRKSLQLSATGVLGMLLLPTQVFAQAGPYALAGRVADPHQLPVAGASVRLLATNRVVIAEAFTDSAGRFILRNLPAGQFELRVEAPGFAPFEQLVAVPLASVEPLQVNLKLTPLEFRVTVTARHGESEETFVEPASIRIRGAEELAQRDVSHLPRMLTEEPGILTQETTPGQGSPILRGQGAQTVLYLVDGIRFNNSTYRSGNTQFLGWIPPAAVDSVEVLLGPAGTQYGSDALGGAINVMSAALPPWRDSGLAWTAESETFFTSADIGGGSALRTSLAGRRTVFSLVGSYKRTQELRAGRGRDSHSSLVRFLGLPPAQVRVVLGHRLPDTDYAQLGANAKLGFRFRGDQFLTFNWVQSEQFGIRRYDRLLGGEGHLRSEFDPQRLHFGYLRYQKIGTLRLRSLHATLSLNRQTDGQLSQTCETSPFEIESNRVTALGYLLSTNWAPLRGHSLDAGAEFYDEFVSARRREISGGAVQHVRPRFPNGTRYQSLGLYLSDDWQALPQKLLLEAGTRFSYFRFHSRSDKNVFVGGVPTVPDATETFTDLTFNAGLSYTFLPSLVAFGRVARGFRAPAVFDLGEQGLTGGGFEVSPREAVAFNALIGDSAASSAVSTGRPWRSLQPEVLWSLEGGLRWRTRRLSGGFTLFDSEFFDSIQRRVLIVPASVVGQQIGNQPITGQDGEGRVFVALDPRPVVSRANIGRVRIQGAEFALRADWSERWSSAVKASLQRGRELDTGHFARRIAPPMLVVSLRWNHPARPFWLEGVAEVSGPQARLNPGELDDPRIGALRSAGTIASFFNSTARRLGLIVNGRLTLTGETLTEVTQRVLGPTLTPAPLFSRTRSFVTLNLRGAYLLGDSQEIFFALTNLTDANYRRHGSGFDAAGLNLSFSYRLRSR